MDTEEFIVILMDSRYSLFLCLAKIRCDDHLLFSCRVAAGLRKRKPSGDAYLLAIIFLAQQKGGYNHA